MAFGTAALAREYRWRAARGSLARLKTQRVQPKRTVAAQRPSAGAFVRTPTMLYTLSTESTRRSVTATIGLSQRKRNDGHCSRERVAQLAGRCGKGGR